MLEDDAPEFDLMRYKANIGAMEFVQQRRIMFQHFDLFIVLYLITIDVDGEVVFCFMHFEVGNFVYAIRYSFDVL